MRVRVCMCVCGRGVKRGLISQGGTCHMTGVDAFELRLDEPEGHMGPFKTSSIIDSPELRITGQKHVSDLF